MKLVMSTSALIGRSPIAVRRRASHSGEGPFFTPRTSRNAKAGQSEGVDPKSSVTLTGDGKRPSIGCVAACFAFVAVCLLFELFCFCAFLCFLLFFFLFVFSSAFFCIDRSPSTGPCQRRRDRARCRSLRRNRRRSEVD